MGPRGRIWVPGMEETEGCHSRSRLSKTKAAAVRQKVFTSKASEMKCGRSESVCAGKEHTASSSLHKVR